MISSQRLARLVTAWTAARRRHRWLDHALRAAVRYDRADGGRLAAAVTYYAFFAVFALCLLGFAVFGFVLDDRAVAGGVGRYLAANLPRLDVQALREARGTAGVLALLALPVIGLFWIDALRSSIRAIWRLPEYPGRYLLRQLIDLTVLAGLGVLLAASLAVALSTRAALSWLVDAAGVDQSIGRGLLIVVGFGLGLAVNTVLAAAMFTGVPRLAMPVRRVLGPALLVAAGLELLKTIGRVYIERTEANPAFQVVAGAVGLLVFLNLVNQLILYAAALTATSRHGTVTDLAARPHRPAADPDTVGSAPTETAAVAALDVAIEAPPPNSYRAHVLRGVSQPAAPDSTTMNATGHPWHREATGMTRPTSLRLQLTLCLPRDAAGVRVVRNILTTALTDAEVTAECRHEILTALAEACNNVVEHAQPADQYEITIDLADLQCSITVTDTGAGFEPAGAGYHRPPPDVEHGRGLYLIATLSDQFRLTSQPGRGTTIQFSKQLNFTNPS